MWRRRKMKAECVDHPSLPPTKWVRHNSSWGKESWKNWDQDQSQRTLKLWQILQRSRLSICNKYDNQCNRSVVASCLKTVIGPKLGMQFALAMRVIVGNCCLLVACLAPPRLLAMLLDLLAPGCLGQMLPGDPLTIRPVLWYNFFFWSNVSFKIFRSC